MVAGVDFGDPVFAQNVRDGVGRVEELMGTELRGGDELMTEAVTHLFEAGGKRFRPLFTVLSVASIFVYRRRRAGWQRLRALEFAWPLIPASYILVGTCMMVYGVIWQPRASLTALATVGAGALVYRYWVRVPGTHQSRDREKL